MQYLSQKSAEYLLPSYPRSKSYSSNASEYPALYKAEAASMIAQLKQNHKYIVSARIIDIDSAGGVENVITITNLSQKRIKYATFSVSYYNRVGDRVSNDIGGFTSQNCKLTGYVEPGEKEISAWCGFYNYMAESIKVKTVTLVFSNGETVVLDRNSTSLLIMEN
jgi:hypothetical protein